MTCPECSNNHRAKYGMICSKCKYRFVFSPKTNSMNLSDPLFQTILDTASARGKIFYTPHQLFATSIKFLRKKKGSALFYKFLKPMLFVCVFIFIFAAYNLGTGLAMFMVIPPFVGFSVWAFKRKVRFSFEDWQKKVTQWQKGHPMDRMIKKGALAQPPPKWKESDIYDYGAEGILICDQDRYVDFFVLNDFHAQQKLLVISEAGYPDYLVATANAMLDERADLPVYLMHDATGDNTTMEDRVKQSGRFRIMDHPVTDLGLFNKNIQKVENLKWTDVTLETHVPFDYFPPPRGADWYGARSCGGRCPRPCQVWWHEPSLCRSTRRKHELVWLDPQRGFC